MADNRRSSRVDGNSIDRYMAENEQRHGHYRNMDPLSMDDLFLIFYHVKPLYSDQIGLTFPRIDHKPYDIGRVECISELAFIFNYSVRRNIQISCLTVT